MESAGVEAGANTLVELKGPDCANAEPARLRAHNNPRRVQGKSAELSLRCFRIIRSLKHRLIGLHAVYGVNGTGSNLNATQERNELSPRWLKIETCTWIEVQSPANRCQVSTSDTCADRWKGPRTKLSLRTSTAVPVGPSRTPEFRGTGSCGSQKHASKSE